MVLNQSPQLTDLYQFTMVQSYLDHGMKDNAVFDFFIRELPLTRNFLMSAGLEQLLDFLEQARCTFYYCCHDLNIHSLCIWFNANH